MKHFFGTLALGLMTFTLVGTSGCKLSDCGADEQEGSDGACIQGKSLSKFDGTDVSKTVDYQAGGSVTISTVYGNVTIEGGAPAGKVEVIFKPFDFEAYDEKELATRQMNENLNLHIQDGANIDVTAARKGSPSNGLGTSITVKLPPEFDGNLTVMNHGDGPLANDGEFDVEVNAVASAKTVTVTNEASLGDCTVNGGASVVSTGVTCRDDVMVHGVSDDVNISTEADVMLSVGKVSPTAKGGKVAVSGSGNIEATFPAGCTTAEVSPTSKKVSCEAAAYDLSATSGTVTVK
ncbi:MAG: hypothetical protein IT377_17745 [Polyangiaceae bacterium]|nr:hypothetical protein [Polyangiaceae bacterium]